MLTYSKKGGGFNPKAYMFSINLFTNFKFKSLVGSLPCTLWNIYFDLFFIKFKRSIWKKCIAIKSMQANACATLFPMMLIQEARHQQSL